MAATFTIMKTYDLFNLSLKKKKKESTIWTITLSIWQMWWRHVHAQKKAAYFPPWFVSVNLPPSFISKINQDHKYFPSGFRIVIHYWRTHTALQVPHTHNVNHLSVKSPLLRGYIVSLPDIVFLSSGDKKTKQNNNVKFIMQLLLIVFHWDNLHCKCLLQE